MSNQSGPALHLNTEKIITTKDRRFLSAGFTLIEVMIVIVITLFFAGIGLFLSADVYHSSLFRADAYIVVSALQRARSRAISNINENPHGVRVETTGYTIFQGATFGTDVATHEFLPIRSGYTFNLPLPIDVVFKQLSGETDFNGNINITNTAKTITVNINSEGGIDY